MMPIDRDSLGSEFRLGVATSSYQIEGGVADGGRGPSIWDRFCHTPGKIKHDHHGDVACDHFHRMPKDVELLAWLGVDAYRFSIAWPRVIPSGRGAINQAGLDFYDRLVDSLLDKGIEPCATLYHWDLPDALAGGWLARETTDAFADYAEAVAKRLGDRVAMWLTHNEPWCQAFLGYEAGIFAPGRRDFAEALLCAHHLLVSHGLAVQALRTHVKSPIGIAPNFMPAHPATSSAEDIAAAQRQDGYFNRWFIEPVLGRGYPRDMVQLYGERMPEVTERDLKTIAQPIDIVGVNYYERAVVAAEPNNHPLRLKFVRQGERPRTADREIYPQGLLEQLRRLRADYGLERIAVTENGAAFEDSVADDGCVHDPARVEFLQQHLAQLVQARREGIGVEAYYAWSLMDNFEWSEGYTLRYGVVYVDFETQERIAKDSAHWLRSLSRR